MINQITELLLVKHNYAFLSQFSEREIDCVTEYLCTQHNCLSFFLSLCFISVLLYNFQVN